MRIFLPPPSLHFISLTINAKKCIDRKSFNFSLFPESIPVQACKEFGESQQVEDILWETI